MRLSEVQRTYLEGVSSLSNPRVADSSSAAPSSNSTHSFLSHEIANHVFQQHPVVELIVRAPGERFVRARVDTSDLPKILSVSAYWRAFWASECQTHYARAHQRGSGKHGKTILLHRLVTEAPDGLTVDHRDHNGLNNCRSNLAVVPNRINALNRREARGKSGFRGVYLRPNGLYRASVMVNGKRVLLGDHFTDPKEASAKVIEFLASVTN